MRVVWGSVATLPVGLQESLAEYRFKVFVERLGWKLNTPPGIERDQFDGPETVYVIALAEEGHIIGCCRLLPTTSPYLLSEVFPDLLSGVPVPRSELVWELSRFSSLDLRGPTGASHGQFSSQTTAQLVRAALDCAAIQGASRLITVSSVGVERIFRRLNLRTSLAAPGVRLDQRGIRAYWIELPRTRSPNRIPSVAQPLTSPSAVARLVEGEPGFGESRL